jgi:predicted metal-dependent hydrolase
MGAGTMTRDEIIRLAQKVDADTSDFIDYYYNQEMIVFSKGQLERFAALVAAAEREACAKVCDSEVEKLMQWHPREAMAVGVCAAAIRARGDK